jgi:hypothetical protein
VTEQLSVTLGKLAVVGTGAEQLTMLPVGWYVNFKIVPGFTTDNELDPEGPDVVPPLSVMI